MNKYKITFFDTGNELFDTQADRVDIRHITAVGKREAIILAQAEQVKASKQHHYFKAELD